MRILRGIRDGMYLEVKMDKSEAAALIKELNKASEAYYNTGHLIMSDAEFDSKIEDLRRWESAT